MLIAHNTLRILFAKVGQTLVSGLAEVMGVEDARLHCAWRCPIARHSRWGTHGVTQTSTRPTETLWA
jgi:hypothetical protein